MVGEAGFLALRGERVNKVTTYHVLLFSSMLTLQMHVFILCFICRDEKAKWIRAKYEDKELLPPPPYVDVAMPQVTAVY